MIKKAQNDESGTSLAEPVDSSVNGPRDSVSAPVDPGTPAGDGKPDAAGSVEPEAGARPETLAETEAGPGTVPEPGLSAEAEQSTPLEGETEAEAAATEGLEPAAATGPAESARPGKTGDASVVDNDAPADGGVSIEAVADPGSDPEQPAPSNDAVTADPAGKPEMPRPGSIPAAGQGGTAYKALAFVLEVALLGAVGLWAIDALPFTPIASVAIVAVPLVVFWGVFMSPQAPLRLHWPLQPVIAHLLFAIGTGLLFIAQQPVMGAAMGLLTAVSIALTLGQRKTLLSSGIIARRPAKPEGRRSAR